jgi:beta-lactamase class A
MGLEGSLRTIVELQNATIGLSVAELPEGKVVAEINGNIPFRSASVIKVPIIYELFRKSERGLVDVSKMRTVDKSNICVGGGVINALRGPLDFRIEDLATLMIIVSDNSATNELIDVVGVDDVNSTMKELGLKNTVLRRKMLGDAGGTVPFEKDNTMSPHDCIDIMKEIYSGSRLSKQSYDRILEMMKQQKLAYKLPRYLPAGTVFASKGGSVKGVSNDVAIFYFKRPVAVAVMCNEVKHGGYGTDIVAQLGRAVADAYS